MSHEQSATAAATLVVGAVVWRGWVIAVGIVGIGMDGRRAHFSSGRRSALQPDFEFSVITHVSQAGEGARRGGVRGEANKLRRIPK